MLKWVMYMKDMLPVRRQRYRNLLKTLYSERIVMVRPKRYRNLLETVYVERFRRIMEIGTYDGIHACQMIQTAHLFYPIKKIQYYGFDLFDALTNEDLQKEFSKKPPTYNVVRQRLEKTGATINLYMGYTKDTLPNFLEKDKGKKRIDFVLIDGGHSIETITSDWNYVKKIMSEKTIVIFDDYYNNKEPEVSRLGCQSLISDLDTNVYDIEMLEPEDHFEQKWGTLRVNMVKVRLKRGQHG